MWNRLGEVVEQVGEDVEEVGGVVERAVEVVEQVGEVVEQVGEVMEQVVVFYHLERGKTKFRRLLNANHTDSVCKDFFPAWKCHTFGGFLERCFGKELQILFKLMVRPEIKNIL